MSRWQKIAGWSAVAIFGLVLLVVVTVTVLVHSESFHHYLIGKVEASASVSLNAKVKLRDFKLSLSTLTLDLYGLDIHSSEPDPNAPLLHVDHIGGSVKIISAIHRQWNLSDVQVDHPVVHLLVDANGNNNLPKPKTSNSQSNTNIFDLAVKRAALNNGEVYYNDRKSNVDADLLELAFQSSYDAANGGRYFGTLGYKQGNLRFGDYMPIQHDLSTNFDANRSGLRLDPVNFVVGRSHVVLHASMQDYSNPVITSEYDVSLDATEFRRILKNASVPAGIIRLAGKAQYQSDPKRPMLDTVLLDGSISSPSLLLDQPGLRTEVRAIDGKYRVQDGNAELSYFRAIAFGGEITATGSVKDLSRAQEGTLRANAKGVSAAVLKAVANSAALKDVSVAGQLNASADATWSGSMNHLAATTDADLQATISNPKNGLAAMPVNAVIHAKYAGDSKTIALRQSYVRTPQTSINLDGTMANRSNLQIEVRANDLRELEALANLARTPTPGQPAPAPLGLGGTATFDGQLRGTTTNPQLTGQLAATNLQVHGSSWRQLRTNVALSPSSAALQNSTLIPATRGRIAFNIQVGLKKWAYTSSNPINVVVNANQVSLQDLQQVASQSYPASGTLSLNVNVHGTQLDPIGNGTLSLVDAKISQEPIQLVNATFNGTGDVVHANLDIRIPAGETKGNLTYYPKQQGYEAVLKTTNLQLGQLQTLRAKNMQIAGALNVDVTGRGTINDPRLQAKITIPQLRIRDQVMKGISLQADVANRVGTFNLNSEIQNTYVKANGRVNLTGDYPIDATLDTRAIPLQPIFAVYAPAQAPDMNGETELHATIKGPLKKKEQIEAHANIPVLRMSYKQLEVGAAAPIKFDYANNVLTVQPAEIKGTGTDLRFGGRIPLDPTEAASLNATGAVDLQLAEIFVPDLSSKGQIRFDINSAGNLKNPDVQGKIQIVDANIVPADFPFGLSGANGELTLTRDRLQVNTFNGTVGGGQVTATGGVIYKPSLQFNLALAGNGIHFLYNDAIRIGADSNLALTGNLDSAYLRGQVALTRLAFTPDFDLTTFASSFSGGSVSAPSGGFMQNLKLSIAVQSTSQLNLVSKGFSLQGAANLRVVGTADNPVILGRTTISNGDLIFNGNRYLLQNGTIEFVNPVETEPVVNLAVNTTINEYNINLRMHGPVTQLQTTYTSDPSLPPVDIINLIAFGKTTEASAQQNAQNPQSTTAGAESLIASGISSQVTSRVSKIAGISQLSIDPGLGGGVQNSGPKIAIQQRVTGNLFVTFSSDLTGTQREQVQVEYHLNRKWSVSGIRDQNGGFGFDARAHKDF